jgi:Met-zincin/Domain of unknown function (DUF5117)
MKSFLLALCLVLFAQTITAQVKKTPAPPKARSVQDSIKFARDSTWKAMVKDKQKTEGLFTFYQDTATGSAFIYIKKDQLGKEFIYQSFSMGGPALLFLNQNMLRENWVFKLRKRYNKIEFLRCNTSYYYDSTNAVSKARDVDVSDAVFHTGALSAEDSAGYLVSADALFISEKLDAVKPIFPPGIPPTAYFNLGSLVTDKSGYEKIRSFPNNSDIVVSLAYDNPMPMNGGDNSITDARYVRVKMQHSFIEMPKNDYKPRFDDPRVGYFTTQADDLTSMKPTRYHDKIHRWNLVKKDPSATLSEPVEPITWWVENTTPVELRQIILNAGAKWNEAFEYAGFRNAVVMKMMPDTASWDPADIRYNVIRYVASDLGFAIGPSFVNPRTGQIIGSDITMDHGFFRGIVEEQDIFKRELHPLPLNNKNYSSCTIASGMMKEYAAGYVFAEFSGMPALELTNLKEQFYTELVLHEMGHTMGLNHNMKSSHMLSPAELQDTSITRKWGVMGSVMDYSSVNVAPDLKPVDYYSTKTGPYDWWAIEYGYRQFAAAEESAGLNKILERSTEPKLIFGNDADIAFGSSGIDPRVQVWDMSNDMATYATGRFQLVNSLMGKLKEKYAVTGASYTDLRRKYYMLFNQRFQMGAALSSYVSGIYVDRSFVGQNTTARPFTPVPDEYKKKVMTALNTYVFAPNAFDSDAPLYPYLQMQRRGYNFGGGTEDPKPENDVLALQSTVLYGLMNSTSLSRASRTTLYGNSYSPAAILNEVTSMTFDADLRGDVNLYRQNLQKTYVDMLIGMMKDPKYDNASVSAAYENLKQIRSKLDKLKSGNEQTNAHRGNLKYLIDKALVIK